MKAYPSNHAYDCVFNPLYENVYEKQPNAIQSFWTSNKIILWKFWYKCGWHITIPEKHPWLSPKPIFNLDHFAFRSVTSAYTVIHTNGSEDGDRVVSAAVFVGQVYSLRLPSANSIFNAEGNVTHLPLKFAVSSDESKFIICSDFFSCLLAIENCKTQSPFILKIRCSWNL